MALAAKDKKLLMYLFIGLIIYGIYMLYTTQIPEYEKMQRNLETLNKQIRIGRGREQQIPQLREEVTELVSRLQVLEKRLPQQDIGLTLLTKLEELGRRVDVSFDRLSFGTEREHGLYKSLEINMTPVDREGGPLSMEKVFMLVYALDNFENLLDINVFNITPANPEKTKFNLRLTANVYMFRQEEFERSYR
jgi:Tfp pilus assembly protein PilO